MSTKNLSDFSGIEMPSAANFRIGIVVATWNPEVTGALRQGAVGFLLQQGAQEENIKIIEVPGSFELTSGANLLLRSDSYLGAVICLGCVIQGETRHFDFICGAVANGITQVSLQHNKPVIFGVLTTDNLQQALDRSGGKHGNKGAEAAATAVRMIDLSVSLQKTSRINSQT